MFRAEFFGAEPILHDKVISYTERRGVGKYVYESEKLANVITGYKNTDNYAVLEQILRELFWICNQGRRPWSLEAEQSFLALTSVGYDLLTYLRAVGRVPDETYTFIDPLDITLRLEHEAEHLQEIDNKVDSENWGSILEIFYRLASLYISVFDYWVSDFPQMAKIPTIDSMKYLLETGNDSNFAVLLTAFAKTQDPKAKQVLIDFSRDDEQSVKALTEKLLAMYF